MIERYLAQHPPPAGCRFDADLADWAERLQLVGRKDLDTIDARPLAIV